MSALALLGTGMGMGVVHVLTGPDHLSALATLSANVGNFKAFAYGVRWGVGHSIGLVLVGSILIMLDYSNQQQNNGDDDGRNDDAIDMPKYIDLFCETMVGVCMLLLGLYGFVTAYRKHNGSGDSANTNTVTGTNHGQGVTCNIESGNGDTTLLGEQYYPPTTDDPSFQFQNGEASMSFHDHHHHLPQCCSNCNIPKPIITLGIGIIHGIAGPGGVLGVIPAVQLHNWKLAIIYLGSFCFTSTLTMGLYAALYGSCTHSFVESQNSAVIEYRMEMFSAGLSVFVGVLWLFLLSIGKLDDFFP
jgi:hypothetical protein